MDMSLDKVELQLKISIHITLPGLYDVVLITNISCINKEWYVGWFNNGESHAEVSM